MVIVDIYSNKNINEEFILGSFFQDSFFDEKDLLMIQFDNQEFLSREYQLYNKNELSDYLCQRSNKRNIKFALSKEYFIKNRDGILDFFDKIFIDFDLSFISIDSLNFYIDNKIAFHLENIDKSYDYSNIVFDVIDRTGNEFKVIGNEIKEYQSRFGDVIFIDKEYLVGHTHFFDLGIMLTCSAIMYFSKCYDMYLDSKSLKLYDECYDNKLLSKNDIRIWLFEDIFEYDKAKNIQIMWNFRHNMKIDYIAHRFLNIEYPVLSIEKLKRKINGLEIFGRFFNRTFVYGDYKLKSEDNLSRLIENKMKLSKYRFKKYKRVLKDVVKLKNKYDNNNESKIYSKLLTKYYALEAVELTIDTLGLELDFTLDSIIIIDQLLIHLKEINMTFANEEEIERDLFLINSLSSYLAVVLVVGFKFKYLKTNEVDDLAVIYKGKNEYDLKELLFHLIYEAKDEDLHDLINEIIEVN